MAVDAASDSFTQLLTFWGIIQEGVVEGSSVVTGFIYIFLPCPPVDTDVKQRERNAWEEGAGQACRSPSMQDQAPGDTPVTQSPCQEGSPSPSPAACGGQGLCQLRLLPIAEVGAVGHPCPGKRSWLSPACWPAGKALR